MDTLLTFHIFVFYLPEKVQQQKYIISETEKFPNQDISMTTGWHFGFYIIFFQFYQRRRMPLKILSLILEEINYNKICGFFYG